MRDRQHLLPLSWCSCRASNVAARWFSLKHEHQQPSSKRRRIVKTILSAAWAEQRVARYGWQFWLYTHAAAKRSFGRVVTITGTWAYSGRLAWFCYQSWGSAKFRNVIFRWAQTITLRVDTAAEVSTFIVRIHSWWRNFTDHCHGHWRPSNDSRGAVREGWQTKVLKHTWARSKSYSRRRTF